ncbi:DUF3397 family protein [Kurthia massiliensis]|uniref:DUF3397 family protein n=1 Tax=Kurthia massiliensis TaxID=1033739 RepID=UPI000289BA2F|nr:DUF3397 family protein [Kurthia massiliensis]
MSIFSAIFSFFAEWPWLVFIVIFFMMKLLRQGKRAFGVAADVTTFCLLFSIPQLTKRLYDLDIGVMTGIVAVVFLMMMTTIQWRTQPQLKFLSVLKLTWRILFLMYVVIYIVLWALHLLMA